MESSMLIAQSLRCFTVLLQVFIAAGVHGLLPRLIRLSLVNMSMRHIWFHELMATQHSELSNLNAVLLTTSSALWTTRHGTGTTVRLSIKFISNLLPVSHAAATVSLSYCAQKFRTVFVRSNAWNPFAWKTHSAANVQMSPVQMPPNIMPAGPNNPKRQGNHHYVRKHLDRSIRYVLHGLYTAQQ